MAATPSPPGLTAEQHRAIRRQLALIPAYVWIFYIWQIFFVRFPVSATQDRPGVLRDFLHFYTQGRVTLDHDARALYDIDEMAAAADRALPGSRKHTFPPVYGPQVGLFFSPFATLDYVTALRWWLVLTLAGYALCVYLVWRGLDALRGHAWLVLVLALGAPGLHFTLSFGQASVIGLLCFTLLWLAMREHRWFIAGLAVGLLAYKPQLAAVAAVAMLARRQWLAVFGAATAVGIQALAVTWYWGPAIFSGYVKALSKLPTVIDRMEPDRDLTYTVRSLLSSTGLSAPLAVGLTVAASVALVAVAARCWWPERSPSMSYVGMVMTTMLVNPHLYAYDLLVVTPALLVAWDRARKENDDLLLFFAAALLCAPIVTVLIPTPVPWTLLAVACLATRSLFLAHASARKSL